MKKELKAIEISKYPELVRIAKRVRKSGKPSILRRNGEALAVVKPMKSRRKKASRTQPVTRDDAIFRLIGLGKSGIIGGISEKKHEYFLQAYRATHQ